MMADQLTLDDLLARKPHFDGSDPTFDQKRLTGQLRRVFDCLSDHQWHTLAEIAAKTGDPEASISAQTRHLKKPRFGSHPIVKQRRGDPKRGLWEYKLEQRP